MLIGPIDHHIETLPLILTGERQIGVLSAQLHLEADGTGDWAIVDVALHDDLGEPYWLRANNHRTLAQLIADHASRVFRDDIQDTVDTAIRAAGYTPEVA